MENNSEHDKLEKRKKRLKKIYRWVGALIFIGLMFNAIEQGSTLSAIFFLVGALFCAPFTYNLLFRGIDEKLNAVLKVVIVGALFFAGVALSNSKPANKADADVITVDTSAAEKSDKLKSDELTKRFNIELKNIDTFNGSTYRGTIENLQMELVVFSAWAKLIDEGVNDKNNKDLALKLKNKVKALQIREFPLLRNEYSKIAGQKLWENDIYMNSLGSKKTILNITGGLFAANKNIKDTQDKLSEVLTQFRFKQIRYRWYKESEEYTYYDLASPNDGDIIDLSQ